MPIQGLQMTEEFELLDVEKDEVQVWVLLQVQDLVLLLVQDALLGIVQIL
jgi:hypothetical protein